MQPVREMSLSAPDATVVVPPVPPARHGHLWRWILGGVALALVAVAVVFVVRLVRRPPEVQVVAAKREDVSRMLAVTGRIEAERTVVVTPRFAGRLTEIVRHEGERVTQGEVLARLEDTSAVSTVSQQRATLSSKTKDLAQARRELARTEQLVASSAVPAAELETARLTVSQLGDDIARLSAILKEGRAQLVLVAPFAGTILSRDGELGQVVGPTTTVFEIATVDASRVTSEVDERYVRALVPGMRAEILPAGAEQGRQAATISYIAQAVDPTTGAATVRFAYGTAPAGALIGMSVDINVSVGTVRGAVTIPREAIGGAGASPFVLVAVGDRIERRDLVVEDWPAAAVVVSTGLAAGDLVVLDPKAAVVGARVRVKVAQPPAEGSDGL
jgi:RND family efflux transporter MFP subunit